MKTLKNIPLEIDYEEFRWLRKGDRLKIAQKTNMSISMVCATLKKQTFNLDILTEAMKMVVEKKRRLLEVQAEAEALSRGLKMRVV